MRALVLTVLLLIAAASPAVAAEGGGEAPHYVDLLPVALPVVTQGRLRNYVFVTVRINLNEKVDATVWHDKEPYLRDALVRAAHRHPFSLPNDWMRLDEAALKRGMLAEAVRIGGPGVFTSVEILKASAQKQAFAPRP